MRLLQSIRSTAVLALLVSSSRVCAAPLSSDTVVPRQIMPTFPSDDPFYIPPAGFADTAPGTILGSRSIIASIFDDIPNPVAAWQVLYRTTAVNGSAIATVTTIFKPANAKLDRVVAYATYYDSSTTQCEPSYSYLLGSRPNNIATDVDFVVTEAYIRKGYIVSSPDYEGPDAAFGAGHLAGMSMLDSMRAVANFGSTLGLSTATPAIVGVGYSGGALAIGWTASLQPTYAPELNIKGWAHGGTPVNLTSTLLEFDDTSSSGFFAVALAGLASPSAYGAQLQPLLTNILTAKGQAAIAYAQTHCFENVLLQYPFTSALSTEIQTLGPAFMQNPIVEQIFTENIVGLDTIETPNAPVLVYHAVPDELIPYIDAAQLVQRWCNRDANVNFLSYQNGGHGTTWIVALPEVFQFVDNAFAGNTPTGCSSSQRANTVLNPIDWAIELEPVLGKLITLLGRIVLEHQLP